MQLKRARGQFAVKRFQLPDLMDAPGAGPTHELPALTAGPLRQRRPARPVLTPGRGEQAPRGHLLHFPPKGGLVLAAPGKLPLQG